MNIIKVVVDYLPKNASCCKYAEVLDQTFFVKKWALKVSCKFKEDRVPVLVYNEDYISKRCPGCPLEEVQE